ncbi:Protein ALP1-like [Dissostichus eleginoides]|uniref:Protein ALP1-like n=1 Tax=Dissostichus eleginoides TaxID=100907 RepID=A0AAD9CJT3_DISEL|nr:Protein ALP1-like [Dissostichus eleginoides]
MCDTILCLLEKVLHFPTKAKCAEVGPGFHRLANSPAFSQCVGAIDGCHIRINAPNTPHAQDYLNRKLFFSVQLQGICDSYGTFLDIFVGYPGSVHDTRVLRNTPVFVRGCYPPAGHFIVGDAGYPCLSEPLNLITPYREPWSGRVEACFNQHHARA